MGHIETEFRIAPVATTQAQRQQVIASLEQGQPLINTKLSGDFLGRATMFDELQVDLYGSFDAQDGYEVEAVALRGTRVDISLLVTPAQFESLNAFANFTFPTAPQLRAADRADRAIDNFELVRVVAA